MKKFIPYEKLSKKTRRQIDQKRRGSWGAVNPVTRYKEDGKAYKRPKAPIRYQPDAELFLCARSA